MKIAILTDKPRAALLAGEEGYSEDLQKRKTVLELKEVLSKKFDCIVLKADLKMIPRLQKENVDLVFNLCNGLIGDSKQAQVPAILEFMGIPYTGSSVLGHALAINKNYSCKIFKSSGIPTPNFIPIYDEKDLQKIDYAKLPFPLLIKPCDEGSGRGIQQNSLVFNEIDLKKRVREKLAKYNPPILINEYIEGREFTVGILGNRDNLTILPILEIRFDKLPKHLARFYSFEVKSKYGDQTVYKCPAPLDEDLKHKIEQTAKKAFNALHMKDYARVDIRLKGRIPYVLEINSLPGLQRKYSDITKMADACDLGYEGLVLQIVQNAINRYNSNTKNKSAV